MRLSLLLTAFTFSLAAHGQTKIYDLNKLDSVNFKDFISNKKVIVIGEMHGTAEVPWFVLQLIQRLSKTQKTVTVGLEIPINYQSDIEDFIRNGNFEKLLTLDHFKYPDGRTSIAMGQLIKGLRSLKNVKVICFDIASTSPAGMNRDSLMGINLSRSYNTEQMVILTGNLHANLKEGYWKPNFKSATYYFNKMNNLNDQLISLNTYFGSGTIWNCMQDGCKERDVWSDSYLKDKYGLKNFIGIYDGVHPSGYSGFIYLNDVTASKPMVN